MTRAAAFPAAVMLCAAQANAATYVVGIDKMTFAAPPQHLVVGDTIAWKNNDIVRHTVTAVSQEFDLDLAPKAQGTITLHRAGRVDVYCRFHPTMKVTLVVEGRGK